MALTQAMVSTHLCSGAKGCLHCLCVWGPLLLDTCRRHHPCLPLQDVFSAGCVIAELFMDGAPLFDLGSLLSYRRGEFDSAPLVHAHLEPGMAALVLHMIQLDAGKGWAGEHTCRHRMAGGERQTRQRGVSTSTCSQRPLPGAPDHLPLTLAESPPMRLQERVGVLSAT